MTISSAGCRKEVEPKPPEVDERPVPRLLRVAIVEDPDLAVVIQRQWKARTEGEIELVDLAAQELNEADQLSADVVIYPSAWLGTLAERKLIEPLSNDTLNNAQLDQRGTFDLQRINEVTWGEQTYAVTFGSPQLVLMYRADLFEQLRLVPPATWQDYGELLTRLGRESLGEAAPPDDQPWSAVAEPWAPLWASRVLLARAAAYARHPSQYSTLFELRTGKPLIAGAPFQRALQELADTAKFNVKSPFELTPQDAKAALLAGHTAMAWCWASSADSQEPVESLPEGTEFGFAELPGSDRVYNYAEKIWNARSHSDSQRVPSLACAGRLGSITREARYPRDAANMLCWLSGKQWGVQIAAASPATTLYRQVHVNQAARWVDKFLPEDGAIAYANLVATAQSRGVCLVMPRVPGWMDYMTALDAAVEGAVNGQSVQSVLDKTAEQWHAITERIGIENQQAAFYRDLGLEP
jgi:ABC-type glycerol-3-phosphate transport system substrate-binding protein